MPQPRIVWNFQPFLWEAVERVGIAGETLEQRFDEPHSALSIRQRWYGFKTAIRKEYSRVSRLPAEHQELLEDRIKRLIAVAKSIDNVVCWIDEDNHRVRFVPLEKSPANKLFAGFKTVEKMLEIPQELQRLQEKIQGEELPEELKPKLERDFG